MKIGIMQSILAGANDLEQFQHAARLGFRGVEAEISDADLDDPASTRLASLSNAKDRSGLEIPSICLGAAFRVKDDPASRDAAIVRIKRAADWAVELKAEVILLAYFFSNELKTGEDFEIAADGFKQLCAYAEGKGVKMTYEGTYAAEQLRALANAVASPAFGDYFDVANVVWLGMDTADQIRKRGSLIVQVHFKESREGPGDCRPGQGRVNYAASAEALREIGYDSWLVFEVPPGTDDELRADIATAHKYFEVES